MIRIHLEVEIDEEMLEAEAFGPLEPEDAEDEAERLASYLKDHPMVTDAWVANVEFE